MAIALVNHAGAGSTSAVTSLAAGPIAVTAGNMLMFGCVNLPGGATLSDTAGNTFTPAASVFSGLQIFYKLNCAGNASDTFTANFSSTAFVTILIAQVSGIALSSALDATASGSGASGTTLSTGTFSTRAPNEIILAIASDSDTNCTTGAGFTNLDSGTSFSTLSEYQIVSSLQSGITATAAQASTAAWQIVAATFSATPIIIAGGAGPKSNRHVNPSVAGCGIQQVNF